MSRIIFIVGSLLVCGLISCKQVNLKRTEVISSQIAVNPGDSLFTEYLEDSDRVMSGLISKSKSNDLNEAVLLRFALMVRNALEEDHYSQLYDLLPENLNTDNLLTHKLVSLYALKSYYAEYNRKIDTIGKLNIFKDCQNTRTLPTQLRNQLIYRSVLANLGETALEDEILGLIQACYSTAIESPDSVNSQRVLLILYRDILPLSIGMIQTKKSTIESLYLLEEELIFEGNSSMLKYNSTQLYIQNAFSSKLQTINGFYLAGIINQNEKSELIDKVRTGQIEWLWRIKD